MGKTKHGGRERQPGRVNLGICASLHEKSADKVCQAYGNSVPAPPFVQAGGNFCCEVY